MSARHAAAFVAVLAAIEGIAPSAHARGCSEVSDIVGYERCSRFGRAWAADLPRFVLSIEASQLTFDPTVHTFDVSKDKSHVGRFSGRDLGVSSLSTGAGAWRIDGYLWGPIYLGLSTTYGFGRSTVRNTSTDGSVATGTHTPLVTDVGFAGILGLRVPLGRVSLRAETVVGGRSVSFGVAQGSASAGAVVLQPRVDLDVWVSPVVSMSAYAGVDALDRTNRSFGLQVAWHLRSFDGSFALW